MSNRKTYSSEYWVEGKRKDVTAENMSASFQLSTTALNYPYSAGIPFERVYTHYLRYGGENTLSLTGYSNRDIKKWGNRK